MPRRKDTAEEKARRLERNTNRNNIMLISIVITDFISMDILPTTSCLLEKIMMFIKDYNDILLSRNHKKDKNDSYNIWNHLHLLTKELRGAIEEEVTN
jgi:hypothetical protein